MTSDKVSGNPPKPGKVAKMKVYVLIIWQKSTGHRFTIEGVFSSPEAAEKHMTEGVGKTIVKAEYGVYVQGYTVQG